MRHCCARVILTLHASMPEEEICPRFDTLHLDDGSSVDGAVRASLLNFGAWTPSPVVSDSRLKENIDDKRPVGRTLHPRLHNEDYCEPRSL